MCRDLEGEVGVTMSSNETRVSGHPDFQDVYGEFHQRIQRYLTRLLGSGEADDVTQEVFAKVSQSLPQFRGESSISTWMYSIATNTAYDRLRSPSFRRAEDLIPLENTAPVPDPSSGIDQTLVRTEMNECIDEYIARLPASYRSVVILSEHEGLTNQEIADALGVSLGTVKIRLHRARARLRQDLGGGCSFYRDGRNEFACQPKPRGVSPHD
jgi:RNA polymerase sigma-70 factor (ECF subfamily)